MIFDRAARREFAQAAAGIGVFALANAVEVSGGAAIARLFAFFPLGGLCDCLLWLSFSKYRVCQAQFGDFPIRILAAWVLVFPQLLAKRSAYTVDDRCGVGVELVSVFS